VSSPRESHDWLSAFVDYTQHGEAPTKCYFWVGIASIAGALKRRVWIDQATFKWYPNLYTLLVAPPGVVSKSTTAALGMDLLRSVPGVEFGPDVVTWQALFDAFNAVHEAFQFGAETLEMSALTIAVSEFGNFLRPDDREMVDQLVNLWDGYPVKKRTRMDGEQIIQNPCLNVIGCTTPSWIAQNFPEYMIGGGLTSRLLFVYADQKVKYVAYPFRHVPADFLQRRDRLIRDLERISQLKGPFTLTEEAIVWGEAWYERFHKVESKVIDETLLGGYINRKQTLVHKIAMCISVSQSDDLVITQQHLERAVGLITELEAEMPKVYSRIGMSAESAAGLQAVAFIKRQGGPVTFHALYRYMHKTFPHVKDFEDVVAGLVQAGLMILTSDPVKGMILSLPTP
jgi:hypothetical protein